MPRSIWRTQAAERRKRLPSGATGRQITGIVERIVDVGQLEKIGGLIYHACPGYQHQLDGQEIDFDPPVERDKVPAPWRALLEETHRE